MQKQRNERRVDVRCLCQVALYELCLPSFGVLSSSVIFSGVILSGVILSGVISFGLLLQFEEDDKKKGAVSAETEKRAHRGRFKLRVVVAH